MLIMIADGGYARGRHPTVCVGTGDQYPFWLTAILLIYNQSQDYRRINKRRIELQQATKYL